MIACYIFNGKDKLLPGRGSLPAKFIGNCLLLTVEVLPPVELFCVVGEELSCRTGRGREGQCRLWRVPYCRWTNRSWEARLERAVVKNMPEQC